MFEYKPNWCYPEILSAIVSVRLGGIFIPTALAASIHVALHYKDHP